jgi:hypothetical protein
MINALSIETIDDDAHTYFMWLLIGAMVQATTFALLVTCIWKA